MKDNLSNRKTDLIDEIKPGDAVEVSSNKPLISIILSDKDGNVKKTINVFGCKCGIFIKRRGNVGYYRHIKTGKILTSPMDRIIKTNKK
jgi:hypothetical protein